jgi:cytoskeleton protein RodZ
MMRRTSADDETTGARILAMGAFGERLRREREMRGITLDEISESTKISRRHLESLEREDFDSLPGGIFNKGFVRAYARFLGLDEDQAVADYTAITHEEPAPADQFPLEVHQKPNRELNPRRSPLPLLLAILALVGVLAVVWTRSRSRRPESAAATPPPAPVSTVVVAPPVAAPTTVAERSPVTPVTPVPTPVPVVKQPTPDPNTFVVLVRAKEDSWVSLQADGKLTWEGFLRANRQRFVRAGKRVVLTTNNAGGLVVRHNGKLVRALGSESEIRTVTFTAAGLVQ